MQWISGDGIRDFEFPNNEGGAIWVRDFFGSGSPSPRSSDEPVVASQRPPDVPLMLKNEPRVFLTRRPPSDVIPPHFHEIAQYQVVVEGSGRIGKHDLRPLTVHYTDAYTPYGPIVTSDEGDLAFFTIRARSDNGGTHFMPGSRTRMPRRAGRALTVHTEVDSCSRDLIPTTEDGVESRLISITRGKSAELPVGGPKQDRFYVVLSGSLIHENEEFGVYSCIYLTEGEPDPTLTAGPKGAEVLLLQFPPAARMTA